MKQGKVSIVLAMAALVLAACSPGSAAPKCSDQKVIDVLSRITFDDFVKKAAKQREDLKILQLTPEELAEYDAKIAKMTSLLKTAKRVYTNIVMKDTNEKTGAHTCAATEEVTIIDEGQTISDKQDFTYTVEKLDDGKSFIVTTEGLIR